MLFALLVLALFAADPDLRLLRRALAGHGAAMRRLVDRLLPVIRARVRRRIGGPPEQREDVVQDVWVYLLSDGGRVLRRFDPEKGSSLEGFVGMLTERQIIDLQRVARAAKRGADKVVHDDAALARAPDARTPEEAAITADLVERLGAHLHQVLSGTGQLVFRLIYTDHCTPAEAAEAMGVKIQVVYNWQHRIRKEVRAVLAP